MYHHVEGDCFVFSLWLNITVTVAIWRHVCVLRCFRSSLVRVPCNLKPACVIVCVLTFRHLKQQQEEKQLTKTSLNATRTRVNMLASVVAKRVSYRIISLIKWHICLYICCYNSVAVVHSRSNADCIMK